MVPASVKSIRSHRNVKAISVDIKGARRARTCRTRATCRLHACAGSRAQQSLQPTIGNQDMRRHILAFAVVLTAVAMPTVIHARNSAEVLFAGFSIPEYRGSPQKKIIVFGRIENIFLRDQLETQLVGRIHAESRKGTVAVRSLDLLPPIKEYTSDDIDALLKKEEIESVLFITVSESAKADSNGWNVSFAPFVGGKLRRNDSLTLNTSAQVEMYQAGTKNLMWKGEGQITAQGSAEKNIDLVAKLLSAKIAQGLAKDSLLARPCSRWSNECDANNQKPVEE